MSYTPRVHDYVKWNHNGHTDEGWVYFKGDEYLTIEVSVKDKPDALVNMHKKIHCLVCCFPHDWKDLQYVKNRRDPIDIDQYKSQEGRYSDPQ